MKHSNIFSIVEKTCQDAEDARPTFTIRNGSFIATITGKQRWESTRDLLCIPDTAQTTEDGEALTLRWPSYADLIFSTDGLLSQYLPNYETRPQQLHMARTIQRAIEMGEPAIIEAGTGTGKCVHPDTLVTMSDGTQVRVADLAMESGQPRLDDQPTIAQLSSAMKTEYGNVLRRWTNDFTQTYLVKTQLGREIRTSADHRFLTVDGWKRLKELKEKDYVAISRLAPEPITPQEMDEGEIIFMAHMITDGCCSHAGYRGQVSYTKKDPDIIMDMENAVKSLGNVEMIAGNRFHHRIRRTFDALSRKDRNEAILTLEKHSLDGTNSHTKFIPDAIFKLPNSQLAIFLGRLFSGDGTVSNGKGPNTVSYSTVSKKLAQQVQHLLSRFGIISRLCVKNGTYNKNPHKSWILTITGGENLRLFHQTIGDCLVGKKKARLQNIIKLLPKENPNLDIIPRSILPLVNQEVSNSNLSMYKIREKHGVYVRGGHKGISRKNMAVFAQVTGSKHLNNLANSDVYWDKIISITVDEKIKTFDLQMVTDSEPNFIADGFIVHNSYAYLAIAMMMRKKVVVSTSNKALQMQLWKKDVPLLQQIFPKQTTALAVGKGNYLCRYKIVDPYSGTLRVKNPNLIEFYNSTPTGNIEEYQHPIDWKEQADITVDDECLGKMCPHYGDCFYYEAKRQRMEADIIITNHALLCLDTIYPQAGILPKPDLLVIDEAHQFPSYARRALGEEMTLGSIPRTAALAEKYDVTPDIPSFGLFVRTIKKLMGENKQEIGIPDDLEIAHTNSLSAELEDIARKVWDTELTPSTPDEWRAYKAASRIQAKARQIFSIGRPTPQGFVRWLTPGEEITCTLAPYDVSKFVASVAGQDADWDEEPSKADILDHTYCARCHRKLTAATVAILDNRPYGPDCIQAVDILGDAEYIPLNYWLASEHDHEDDAAPIPTTRRATIFTSATLAAPDLGHFVTAAGLDDALLLQAGSPFDYAQNAMLYVPDASAPSPGDDGYLRWMANEMAMLVHASQGGAFLLFTSHAALNYAYEEIAHRFPYLSLAQGSMPKPELARRFVEDGNAILFGTKSFWEGVSIDGNALRLVAIDKMPFSPPSPLTDAIDADIQRKGREQNLPPRTIERLPFNTRSVPEMIIELKQGLGRLIRTQTDKGAMAILDNRLRLSQYGRIKALPSLPPARLVPSAQHVGEFFQAIRSDQIVAEMAAQRAARQAKYEAMPVELAKVEDEDGLLWAT